MTISILILLAVINSIITIVLYELLKFRFNKSNITNWLVNKHISEIKKLIKSKEILPIKYMIDGKIDSEILNRITFKLKCKKFEIKSYVTDSIFNNFITVIELT